MISGCFCVITWCSLTQIDRMVINLQVSQQLPIESIRCPTIGDNHRQPLTYCGVGCLSDNTQKPMNRFFAELSDSERSQSESVRRRIHLHTHRIRLNALHCLPGRVLALQHTLRTGRSSLASVTSVDALRSHFCPTDSKSMQISVYISLQSIEFL